jgi:outer membrane protein assembly factor BamB
LPTSFGPKQNIAWRAALPGSGPAGPIVVGQGEKARVFVTAASGPRQDRLHVLAYAAASGKLLWQRQLWATGHTVVNPYGGVAAPTPASDGQRVFAFFSSNDLACFDLEGNLQWLRGLAYESPTTRNDVGMASSPLVVGSTVIVQLEGNGKSFAMGLDVATGQTRWKLPRDCGPAWTSPTPFGGIASDDDVVLIQSRDILSAHVAATGKEVWRYDGPCSTLSSPASAGGQVVAALDKGLALLKPDAKAGDAKVVWEEPRLRCNNATPLIHQGRVYVIKSPAILACADLATGKTLWQVRLRGSIWSTPVIADGRLYVVNYEGQVFVVRLGHEGKLVATNTLEEGMLATPAVADGAIYFRSQRELWKVATPGATEGDPIPSPAAAH